jgi:hypothetical protein
VSQARSWVEVKQFPQRKPEQCQVKPQLLSGVRLELARHSDAVCRKCVRRAGMKANVEGEAVKAKKTWREKRLVREGNSGSNYDKGGVDEGSTDVVDCRMTGCLYGDKKMCS